ncbi:MAG TPA: acetyl-CoA carboxylase biotin carboxyl carrier protein [Planctomycetota bacterium]|nr:acetyl-CoA carboxylase biotin carboxyl carrier protein [Planctomycetota bacterium]
MDLKLIQRLVALMARADLSLVDIDDPQSGLKLRLKRGHKPSASNQVPVVHVSGAAPGAPVPTQAAAAAAPAAPADAAPTGKPFPSPLVGTFYRSASPESEPFVSVGAQVGPETVLCIIEAMKVMNEIKAETSGTIVEVLVENGEPVEYGQPLFLIA